jgi:hypothetical protein
MTNGWGWQVAREASKRVLGLRPFDVQLMGGMILHEGQIAEMRTGEGKTLVAVLPAFLNALSGKGVHVVTVRPPDLLSLDRAPCSSVVGDAAVSADQNPAAGCMAAASSTAVRLVSMGSKILHEVHAHRKKRFGLGCLNQPMFRRT